MDFYLWGDPGSLQYSLRAGREDSPWFAGASQASDCIPLLMSHWPKQITWSSRPQGREVDSTLDGRRGKVTLQRDKYTGVEGSVDTKAVCYILRCYWYGVVKSQIWRCLERGTFTTVKITFIKTLSHFFCKLACLLPIGCVVKAHSRHLKCVPSPRFPTDSSPCLIFHP